VSTVRLIGPGRAGLSLVRALGRAGWDVAGVLGRTDDPRDAAKDVDLLVVATPDAAIAQVAAAVEPVDATVIAHLAGSLGLDALTPHRRRAAIHPLVSLPNADIGANRLAANAWFAVTGDPLAHEVVRALGGRALDVPDDRRAAYHAAACVASNHVVALLGQAERIADTAGVPLEAYIDLVRATVENVAALGPAAALTGPAARGDTSTIQRHLDAIEPAERPAYALLVEEARRLAASP
jgi:predicted short-subunit dehydrogenase-like oxidoreductase (DUF2520 family)